MNRSCLVLLLVLVTFWIAFALFVASAIAAPRREAEFPAQPSSGASHGQSRVMPYPAGAPLPSVALQPTNAPANVSMTGYTGNAGWAVPSLGARYLAVRLPRGTVVTVCGPGACWTTRTTDYGPSSRIKPARVADIAVGQWERVCGLPRSRGLCRVTILVGGLPIAPATDLGGTP